MEHIKAQSWKVGLVVVLIMVMAGSAACSKTPAAYTQARATVDAYITAYEAKDAGGYLSLFDQDALYLDNGLGSFRALGPMYVRNLQTVISNTFDEKDFKYDIQSSFVSNHGRFAAIEGIYTNVGKDDKVVSAPMLIILELKGDKIIKETDYYDGSQFE